MGKLWESSTIKWVKMCEKWRFWDNMIWLECRLNGNFFELGFELGWTGDEMVGIGGICRKEVESRDWIG